MTWPVESMKPEEECADLDERIQELEAQCAAMREALEECVGMHERCDPDECHAAEPTEKVCAALATDAGKAMLERLEKAERALDEANAVLKMVEWKARTAREPLASCPCCTRIEPHEHEIRDVEQRAWMTEEWGDPGHAPDCRLKKAIGEGT